MDWPTRSSFNLPPPTTAARPERPPFLFVKTMGGETVSHAGLPEDEIACHEADVLDLEDAGYIRRLPSQRGIVFHVTAEGRRRASQLKDARRASAGGGVSGHPLEWDERVLPVLEAIARAYSRAPSPMGVRTEDVVAELGGDADAYTTALVLDELVRARYLEETASTDQLPGPAWSRLTEKGLQVTAGWPSASGEVAFERLLAAIDARIAEAATPEERSKLERLREGVVDVGRAVVVGVLTTAEGVAAARVVGDDQALV